MLRKVEHNYFISSQPQVLYSKQNLIDYKSQRPQTIRTIATEN